jgi:hypothetical protein
MAMNSDLQNQIEILQGQLNAKANEAEEAYRRAQKAEAHATYMAEMAQKFWQEEWSGMKEYVAFYNCGGEGSEDLRVIEQRLLKEYHVLFGARGEVSEGRLKR